jgi:type II secretory pathway component GspD/PulD (secretin)
MKPTTICLVLAAFVATSLGQNESKPGIEKTGEKAAAPKAPFVFEPGTVELRTLITRCGTYLHRNILVDDNELTPNAKTNRQRPPAAVGPGAAAPAEAPLGPFVELQLPVVTDAAGCEELLTSLLWTRNLVLVPLDEAKGVYEVLAMAGSRAREIPLRAAQRTAADVLARPTLRQFVTVVVRLEHTNATVATNALRPFFANSGGGQSSLGINLGNVGNATSLVLNGPQDLVASALQMLQAADVPQPPEARGELTLRLDALMKQNEQLQARLAVLEEKVNKPR